MRGKLSTILVAALAMLGFAACTEKESNIGVELQDPATLFNGIADTAYGVAYTVRDDSLVTSGLTSGLLGCFADAPMGHNEAILYTQISLAGQNSVEFDQYCHIDSVVLSLSLSQLFPDGIEGYRDLHFEVMQLAAPLTKDTIYFASSSLPVGGTCFYNDVVRMRPSDTMTARMRLDESINAYFTEQKYSSNDELADALKGLRIRILNDGKPVMANVNFASANTSLDVYYTYANASDSNKRVYNLIVCRSAVHFLQFKNHYDGAMEYFNTASNDSLDGSRYLYINPMGGTNINLNFTEFVADFHQKHPHAVIHMAELLLPVADVSPEQRPEVIASFKYNSEGVLYSIPDLTDAYTSLGYDGSYDATRGCYRMRVTQHLQKLVSEGTDRGMVLVLNSRRTSPLYAIAKGCDRALNGDDAVRIQFVYSE